MLILDESLLAQLQKAEEEFEGFVVVILKSMCVSFK